MKNTNETKIALMVCTHARGGMRSVVEAYARDGLMERWHFQSLWTHCEGRPLGKVWMALKAYGLMLSMILRRQVSFLHVHAAMRGSFWRKSFFIATARCFDVPCIMHLHGSEMKTFYNSLSKFGKRTVRWSLEHVEYVVVLSESWKTFVRQAAPKANIKIINNYVALPEINIVNGHPNQFDVLFLGVLGQRKGIYDLLACWPSVVNELPSARLFVGGNGEVEAAKAMAEKLDISASVHFLGWIDGEKKLDLLKNTDIFVLPSYNEGLPMSVLEAMSYGKAVITTRVGGIPELITNEVNGLLIEPGDREGLSNALINLGKNIDSRLSIGNLGRKRVQDSFSDQAVLPQLEKIYAEISS